MKTVKLLALILSIIIFSASSFGDDNVPPFSFVKVESVGLTKQEIIMHSKSFLAENFVSAKQVIQMEDSERGRLIGNVILNDPKAGFFDVFKRIKTQIVIDAKDGKYRLKALNVVGLPKDELNYLGGDINGHNRDEIEPIAIRLLSSFATDIKAYLIQSKTDSEW